MGVTINKQSRQSSNSVSLHKYLQGYRYKSEQVYVQAVVSNVVHIFDGLAYIFKTVTLSLI